MVSLRNMEDGVAKLEAILLMTGSAALKTQHIERGPNDGSDNVSLTMFLDRLEALFSPRPGSVIAQCEFEKEAERGQRGAPYQDIVVYHQRLKFLWNQAFPRSKEMLEEDVELRRKFIMGITDASVRKGVRDQNPTTYSKTLELAQSIMAGQILKP